MNISKYPRIRLHWIDILGDTAWADNDEFMDMECSTCVSEGHLFFSDEFKIMTFASYEVEDGEIKTIVRRCTICFCVRRCTT